jgi:hypothetical protein
MLATDRSVSRAAPTVPALLIGRKIRPGLDAGRIKPRPQGLDGIGHVTASNCNSSSLTLLVRLEREPRWDESQRQRGRPRGAIQKRSSKF